MNTKAPKTHVNITVRSPYETVRGLLEEIYLAKRASHPDYGEEFRKGWDKARKETLTAHGWTEATFYAEMDRRRYSFSGP
jgi:hypothetical protein